MDEGVTSRRTCLGAPDPGDQHLSARLPSHGAAGGHSLDMLSLGLGAASTAGGYNEHHQLPRATAGWKVMAGPRGRPQVIPL